MKAIIVDDEPASIKILEMMISKFLPGVEIAATFTSPTAAVDNIFSLRPDVVFLDVQMPELTGFELLQQTSTAGFAAIVTSNTEKYALKALKVGALDYLVKPIQLDDLKAAIEKVSARKQPNPSAQLEMLMHFFKPQQPKVKRVALTASDHLIFVDTNDILYCESDSNYTTFFLAKGDKVVISKTLKDVEELLEGEDFFRIHASYLINMKHVVKFTRGDSGQVVMSNNQHLTVSRKKKDEFFEHFSRI
jgi:two-component system LytT family response regulator